MRKSLLAAGGSVAILEHAPRVLFAVVRIGPLAFGLLVAHAVSPCNGREEEAA